VGRWRGTGGCEEVEKQWGSSEVLNRQPGDLQQWHFNNFGRRGFKDIKGFLVCII